MHNSRFINNAVRLYKKSDFQLALWEFESAKWIGMRNEKLDMAIQALKQYLEENKSQN